MNKYISWTKNKLVQLLPFFLSVISIGIWYILKSTTIMSNYCDYYCTKPFLEPLAIFSLSFLPGAIATIFVRKKVLYSWAVFAVLYLVFVSFALMSESAGGWNNRLFLAPILGAAFSCITILWAIIHSLMIRRSEKTSSPSSSSPTNPTS